MSQQTRIHLNADVYEIVEDLASIIKNCVQLREHSELSDGFFKIGLSGGSMINIVVESLLKIETDWSKFRFFFCDERLVPFDNDESICGQYKNKLIGKIPVTENQFIAIDPNLSAVEAANDYIKKMSFYFPPDSLPRFDLLLLGVGTDGHTCSLFPNHRLLNETSLWVGSITDAPKPPLSRITFTLPLINNAKECCFIALGIDKAEIIKDILIEKKDVPARRVKLLPDSEIHWLLDERSAFHIPD